MAGSPWWHHPTGQAFSGPVLCQAASAQALGTPSCLCLSSLGVQWFPSIANFWFLLSYPDMFYNLPHYSLCFTYQRRKIIPSPSYSRKLAVVLFQLYSVSSDLSVPDFLSDSQRVCNIYITSLSWKLLADEQLVIRGCEQVG